MAKFSADDLRRIMNYKHNIHNMSVIAHAAGNGDVRMTDTHADEVERGITIKSTGMALTNWKSGLTDSLVAAAGIIAQETAGEVRMQDSRAEEAERGVTIKSNEIPLCNEMSDESLKSFKGYRPGNEYHINLIDSPRHVDFSSEVTVSKACVSKQRLG